MWRFKPFSAKEHVGLEGRTIDVGNLKVHIRNPIAEGGFSCVYHGRDQVHPSKQYAVKHIICNDEESLELVMKEIRVMKLLKGHPNVVALQAYTILDMGRTKEALLVMDFCEKSLVGVLESRGAGYFEEKQVLSIFRDVCNAVFAMHCQSPPIAHRDLKAENILLGSDGMWKLCDFGSTSTNHKRFERAEEMGIEEDNIRKYTTPAYRSPEMWDLLRRELINEKVDIWALGCLLFRICYFKSAFDGESKLQVLNGNYRIPDLPKYSSFITDIIKEMLEASPEARPDITQVWFRVNEQFPIESQKSLPDRPDGAEVHDEGMPNSVRMSPPMPRRSPPPPPSAKEHIQNMATPPPAIAKAGGGAFWSTEHAKNSPLNEDKSGPVFDEEATSQSTLKHGRQSPENRCHPENASTLKDPNLRSHAVRNAQGNSVKKFDASPSEDFEISFFPEDSNRGAGNQTFNTFVADFDTSKVGQGSTNKQSAKEDAIKTEEIDRLKAQLKQSNLEKAEITAKYEKLTAICRSQRQELQELKQTLAARTPSPNRDASKIPISSGTKSSVTPPQGEKKQGTIWELQEGMFADNSSPSPDSISWPAFPNQPRVQPGNLNLSKPQPSSLNQPKPQPSSLNQPKPQPSNLKSVRTTNGNQNKPTSAASSKPGVWGFGTDNFTAVPTNAGISKSPGSGNTSQRYADPKSVETKPVTSAPAGWAGF